MFLSKIIFIISVLLITSCASNSTKLSPEAKKADLYYTHGSQALISKDYPKALEYLLKSIKYDDENSKAHNNLAMAYYFRGDLENAVVHFKKSLDLDPKNNDARNNLGSIYIHQKKYFLAKKEYEAVLKDLTYDKQHRTYYNLALIDLKNKKEHNAIKKLLKSVQVRDDYCPAHYQLGLLTAKRREHNQAIKYFKKASMGTCVKSPEPHYQAALSLIALNENQRALFKLKEIIDRFPDSSQATWSKRKLQSINISQLRKQRLQRQKKYTRPMNKHFKPKENQPEKIESIKF